MALDQVRQAQDNFNNAEKDFIDVAVIELTAAEIKLDRLIKLEKKVE